MPAIERLTITMPHEMLAGVKAAVEAGEYASTSEVMREALRDWQVKRSLQMEQLAALKRDLDKGLDDVAQGRVKDFDLDSILERGKNLLAARTSSA